VTGIDRSGEHATVRTEMRMAKLIQICASENDLFGLDADGAAYHYNFNTDTWMRLGRGRRAHGASQLGESDGNGGAGSLGESRRRVETEPPS
jgi:hypothetical protein